MQPLLAGIRVLDFGRYIAGPYCAALLAEYGAEVIRVEKREGSEDRFVTPVAEGMVVHTHSERLVKYRQMILELLFSERNHVCAVCVMNGHCELQYEAAKIGMDHVRYDYLNPDLPMDASHVRFVVDHNRCILCTRCVRVCDEIEGAHVWDVMGRGANSRVITDLIQPWGTSKSCTSCGKCVQVCPTGALFTKGATVAEMEKQHNFLRWILDGRERKLWS